VSNPEDQHATLGFKTAFYEYVEKWEGDIGSQMNRVYSMCINIYRRLPDIEAAIKTVFSDNYTAEIRQPNMLIVLIFEHIIKGEKLKIGGKLSRMVKDNKEELTKILGTEASDVKTRSLPKYGYLRLNQLLKKPEESDSNSDSDKEEEIETIRKVLKKDGYKIKRICRTNIL